MRRSCLKRSGFGSKGKTPKAKAWDAASRYARLRDALKYCRERGIDIGQFSRPEDIIGKCVTCNVVKSWIRMQAGHWKSRGSGGGSGVYFHECNFHLQCGKCNGFNQGEAQKHEQFIIETYGEAVRDEIERKHRMQIDMGDLAMMAMEQMYKEKYQELIIENGLS